MQDAATIAADAVDARRLLLADGEARPNESLTSMVRRVLEQRDKARGHALRIAGELQRLSRSIEKSVEREVVGERGA